MADRKPFVVGIAGGTCSGKSTLAKRLADALADRRVTVMNMDRYFKNPVPETVAPISRKTYPEYNHPNAYDLEPFFADFDAQTAPGAQAELVIVEGLFALHLDHLREKMDLKVFVDLKSDERLVRRIKRTLKPGQALEDVTDRYLDTVRYRHDELIEPSRWHADIVLNGTLDGHRGMQVLLDWIRSQLD